MPCADSKQCFIDERTHNSVEVHQQCGIHRTDRSLLPTSIPVALLARLVVLNRTQTLTLDDPTPTNCSTRNTCCYTPSRTPLTVRTQINNRKSTKLHTMGVENTGEYSVLTHDLTVTLSKLYHLDVALKGERAILGYCNPALLEEIEELFEVIACMGAAVPRLYSLNI